jgi:hypothetical protein
VASYTLGASTNLSLSAVANRTAVCPGAFLNLSATGAVTYQWSTGQAGSIIVVTPSVSTLYNVTGYSGSCTGSTTVLVMVYNAPTVVVTSSPARVCLGGTVTLKVNGAATYKWNTSPLSTDSVVTVTPGMGFGGFYSVTGFNPGCAATKTLQVQVDPPPPVLIQSNSPTICVGESVTLTAGGASSYTWNTGSNSTTLAFSPSVTTGYTVTGLSNLGCQGKALFTQNVDQCTGINKQNLKTAAVSIYPNPGNGHVTIATEKELTLYIIDETGRMIRSVLLHENNNFKTEITGLQAGIYLLVGQERGSVISKKIIIVQ